MTRHTKARTIGLLCFLVASACSQSHQTESDAAVGPVDASGAAPDAAAPDAAVPLDAAITCEHPLAIERACSADADCGMAFHMADCCGTGEWVGVTESAREAFEASVAACEPLIPLCDCVAGPTRADDGTDTNTPGRALHVRCREGLCETTYRGMR